MLHHDLTFLVDGAAGGVGGAAYLFSGTTSTPGPVATAIAVCHSLSGGNQSRQHKYSGALTRLANFVTDGCLQIPAKYV